MKKIQITKHTFVAIGRRMLHRLAHQLIPNVGTLVMMALLLFAYHAWAAPSAAPQVAPASQVNTGLLSYQGYLTDASSEPLTGDVDITFRLYDAPSGGAALWTEAHTNANAVPVDDGLFNVMLGSLTPISYNSDVGDADQFVGTLTPTASGVYSYTVRFDGNWGVGNPNAQWTYADLDGASNGFDLSNVGVLTVP